MLNALKCAIKDNAIERRAFNEQSRPTSVTPRDVNGGEKAVAGTSNMFTVQRSLARLDSI